MHLFETVAHLFHPRHSNNHRPRILHPEGFLVLLLMVVIFGSGLKSYQYLNTDSGSILGYSSEITPTQVVELTNKERAKVGASQLVVNKKLSDAALAKARDMFADQYWAHYSPKGKSPWQFMKAADYRYSIAGENLARDFMETPDMVQAWMNSPTHKENIVNPRYQEIGIAVVDGVLQGSETTLVVQMFGSTAPSRRAGTVPTSNRVQPTARPVVTTVPAVLNSQALSATEEIVDETVTELDAPLDSLPQVFETPALFRESVEYLQQVEYPPLFSPLHLSKAIFLAMVMLVISVLIYDTIVIEQLNTVRFVGKNFAHIALFLTVLFLIIFFKGGVVGG